MSAQWYLTIDGERQGPFGTADLELLVFTGEIDRETLLHSPEHPEPMPAGTVEGLFPLQQATRESSKEVDGHVKGMLVTRAQGASESSRGAERQTEPTRLVIPLPVLAAFVLLLAVVAVGALVLSGETSRHGDVPGFLAISLIAVAVEGYFIFEICRRRGMAKRIKDTPTSKIGEITDGYREIKGRVVAADQTKMLKAPLSGYECVYYEFEVTEPREGGDRTVVSDVKTAPWDLDDGTGVASVDLEGAKLNLDTDRHGRSGFWKPHSPKLEYALAKYNKSGKGWVFSKNLEYNETILEEGDRLYVLGPATVAEGRVCFKASGDQPLIVSDKSERDLLAEQKDVMHNFMLLAVLLPLAALVGLIIYLNV